MRGGFEDWTLSPCLCEIRGRLVDLGSLSLTMEGLITIATGNGLKNLRVNLLASSRFGKMRIESQIPGPGQ